MTEDTFGFRESDRVLIVHADDIGMNQSSVSAFADLAGEGLVSSGAVMAPCSWFPRVAELCRERPELDVGVHITLTSEWPGYKWRPVAPARPHSGLTDPAGYLHATRKAVESARPEAVYDEMKAQVRLFRESGIDVTHIDTHMFTALLPSAIRQYFRVAVEERLPCLAPVHHPIAGASAEAVLEEHRRLGLMAVRTAHMLDSTNKDDCIAEMKRLVSELPHGIHHLLIHPAKDTPELRDITPQWRRRVAEYECFMSRELRDYIVGSDIILTGYRRLREAMRNRMPAGEATRRAG
jgi:predicted glycoside hydrolase/deacetylase ChbG (UPF0249 family)